MRLDPELGIHHVYTRGTKRWNIFHDDIDRRRFLGTLSLAVERYELRVLASYCLMDNHFHLAVQCPKGGLSDALRDLKSLYARWFNYRHNSGGPIFEDRFGSKMVTSDRQLRQLVRYIHRNPLSIDPEVALANYPWSSHPIYLGTSAAPTWFNTNRAGSLFGNYQSDVERPIASDKIQNQPRASGVVPGTAPLGPPSLARVIAAVASAAQVPVAAVSPTRRNGLIGVAVLIATDSEGYAPSEVMEPFGYRTTKAVNSAARRARRRLREDEQLRKLVELCLARLHYGKAA